MEPNGRVDYLHAELRDLRAYMTQRFDALDEKLDSKADARDVQRLADRVAALEANQLRWSIPRLVGGAFVLAVISALAGSLVRLSLGG